MPAQSNIPTNTDDISMSVYGDNSVPLANNTYVALALSHTEWDTVGMWNAITYTATIPVKGKYLVRASGGIETNTTGTRQLNLFKNGDTDPATSISQDVRNPAQGSDITVLLLCRIHQFNAGDTLQVKAYQNSGVELAMDQRIRFAFQIHKIDRAG